MVSLVIVAGLMGSRGCYCPLLAVDFEVTGSAIENIAVDIQKGAARRSGRKAAQVRLR